MDINLLVGGPQENYSADIFQTKKNWVGADYGAVTLCEHDIRPLLAIGDFDSSTIREQFLVSVLSQKVITAKPEKDETDTELCLRLIEQAFNPSQITIYGATGGRLDHLLANFFCLLRPDFAKIMPKVKLVDKNNVVRFFKPGHYTIKKIPGMKYLAFVPMGKVAGFNLPDEKYQLKDAAFEQVVSLASNEFILDEAHFDFKSGNMCVIWSKD